MAPSPRVLLAFAAGFCWMTGLTVAAPVATRSSNSSYDLTKLQDFTYKPRVFVITDIVNEPDDQEALVRYLLYSNEFDTQGLIACTSTWLRNSTHPERIQSVVEAYAQVVDNLNYHVHPNTPFPSADLLLSKISSGPAVFGKRGLLLPTSDGAQRLIAALKASDEPLYVPCWGGVNTLAQALLNMSRTLSPQEAAAQRAKLRVYTISDQDDTGPWIRTHYPDVQYIVSIHHTVDYNQATWMGINIGSGAGPDPYKVTNAWLSQHIQLGPLGSAYPSIAYRMEGDTPSWLRLVQNGLNHREHIEWGGWGGRYALIDEIVDIKVAEDLGFDDSGPYLYVDVTEEDVLGADGVTTYSGNRETIWRWRDGIQDDFAARMRWTLTPDFAAAAHPPIVNVNGSAGPDPLLLTAVSNGTYVLDATGSYDTDSDAVNSDGLDYAWFWYADVSQTISTAYPGNVTLEALAYPAAGPAIANNTMGFNPAVPGRVAWGPVVRVTAPQASADLATGAAMQPFHVLLQVTNMKGPYPIRRYKRVIFSYDS